MLQLNKIDSFFFLKKGNKVIRDSFLEGGFSNLEVVLAKITTGYKATYQKCWS